MRADSLVFVFPLLLATIVAGCDDEPRPQSDADAEVSEVDDIDDADDVPDTIDTRDATDVTDATDATDTPDSADAETETVDTTEVADGDDAEVEDAEVVVPECELAPSDPAFDDHATSHIPSTACFFHWAGQFDYDPTLVKYTIAAVNNGTAAEAHVAFYDNGFYRLHDEWFWFRLLNGHAVPGVVSPAPVQGFSFPTIASVYAAFVGQTTLPLDLEFLTAGGFEGRLYSPAFYRLANFSGKLAERTLAVGTVVHFAAHPDRPHPEEVWGFELEYSDAPNESKYLERVVSVLEAHLPPAISGKLMWIARSAGQEQLGNALRAAGHWLGDRVLTYDDLVVQGAVEVYNEGIAAGAVNVLTDDFSPNDIAEHELAVIPRVPDDIPPSRAIISAVPQTALAHVNLLAKSRGTPNAFVGGIMSKLELAEWEWRGGAAEPVGLRVIVELTNEHGIRWELMEEEEYASYLALLAPPERHVEQVPDLANAPMTVSLSEGGIASMAGLVPLIGGKSAGFLSFLEVPSMETPDAPMAISIRPFVAHQAEFMPLFTEAFANPDFADDSRVRYLVLEGEEAFLEANDPSNPLVVGFLQTMHTEHANDAIGQIIEQGGARQMLLDKPMRYEDLRALRQALEARYDFLGPTQGLRFRSSSTAEDVPGFNGAGLYVSNTGYLHPSELSDPDDRAKTIERAIKRTWASYWGFQAFEERRAGRIDHFEGNMGVAVHARFDDVKERANAVATFWYTAYPAEVSRRLIMNVQKGALAVTNPGGTLELPEIDEVRKIGNGPIEVLRVQRSTVAEPDEWLFSEAELRTMFEQADAHAAVWLAQQGATSPLSERPKTLVLDYELKYVKAGWPVLASGEVRPERIIWRQARVLDQVVKIGPTEPDPFGTPDRPGFPLATYLPQDLKTAVRTLTADRCESEWVDLRVYRLNTEASQADLFPFYATPFIYRVQVRFKKQPPGLAPSLNDWIVQWTNLVERRWDGNGTRITMNTGVAQTLGIDGFELSPTPNGTFKVWRGATEYSGACTRTVRQPYKSASDYLRGLMPPR